MHDCLLNFAMTRQSFMQKLINMCLEHGIVSHVSIVSGDVPEG